MHSGKLERGAEIMLDVHGGLFGLKKNSGRRQCGSSSQRVVASPTLMASRE